MNNDTIIYDGREWQQQVMVWLRLRYHGQLEEVPDQHVGDFGIEAFSRDGIVYQCYAPEDPLQSQDLYANQRDKMTQDINKFTANQAELQQLFGDLRIREWWFITPEHKSARLTQHAEKKRQEVISSNLPYIDPAFIVTIKTGEEFAQERELACRSQIQRLRIDGPIPGDTEVTEWADANDGLIAQLDGKIMRLLGTRDMDQVISYRNEAIKLYIASQNRVERLRAESPFLWEKIDRCQRDREVFLASECADSPHPPRGTLREQKLVLKEKVSESVPVLDNYTIDTIVSGMIAGWMIQCPIDFPE